MGDGDNCAVSIDRVGDARDFRPIRLVLRDNQFSVRCKDARRYAVVDDNRPRGSIWMYGKGVDIVGHLLDDGERRAIGANGDGRPSGVCGGEVYEEFGIS